MVTTSMTATGSGSASDTRQRILDSAERLYAERGIDGVSMAEINRSAGVKNRSAIHYHFGTKEDLLLAILERHEAGLRERREAMLRAHLADGELGPRQMAATLVEPLRDKVLDSSSGHGYLLIAAQLVGHPRLGRYERYAATTRDGANLYSAYFPDRSGQHNDHAFITQAVLVTGLLYHSLADYVRLAGSGLAGEPAPAVEVPPVDVFLAGLVSAIAAVIANE